MSDLFGNPEDRFSRVAAQIVGGHVIFQTNFHDHQMIIDSRIVLHAPIRAAAGEN